MEKTLHSARYLELVYWLKEQREAQELSMRQLADRLGVSHSFVGKVEQRERKLDLIEYLDYCDALGVSALDGLKKISN